MFNRFDKSIQIEKIQSGLMIEILKFYLKLQIFNLILKYITILKLD